MNLGIDNGDGSYTVAVEQVPLLVMSLPDDSHRDISLQTQVNFIQDALSETYTGTVNITVNGSGQFHCDCQCEQ